MKDIEKTSVEVFNQPPVLQFGTGLAEYDLKSLLPGSYTLQV